MYMLKIIKVTENSKNYKLGKFILNSISSLNERNIKRNIQFGKIRLNGNKACYDSNLNVGDEITLEISDKFFNIKIDKSFLKAPNKIDVIYEDNNLLIVNKPIGLLSQIDKNQKIDTLENRCRKYLYDKKEFKLDENTLFIPTLCNRLDFNTSGLIIIAKNIQVLRIINEKLSTSEIKRYYVCWVHGRLDGSGIISTYLTKDNKTNKVKVIDKKTNYSTKAITNYKVIAYDSKNDISTLEIELVTGKTHQIRAHLQHIKHPIVGERKYSNSDSKHSTQALISYKLVFCFKPSANILNYLLNKTIELSKKKLFK